VNNVELLSGAEMVVRSLRDEGVKYIYGYPGGALLHIYDALFKEPEVTHILVRHEQAATHMADGYARATGKAGVVLVTSGPGATNAVTGIATAYMDSIPMVIISGQVASTVVGTDAFQEVDMVGISRPIVKHSFIIKHPSEIPEVIKKAFYLAESGRPGPVVVDIPKIWVIRRRSSNTATRRRSSCAPTALPCAATRGRFAKRRRCSLPPSARSSIPAVG